MENSHQNFLDLPRKNELRKPAKKLLESNLKGLADINNPLFSNKSSIVQISQKPTRLQKKILQKQKRKMQFNIDWCVHPHRKDKRTGAISPIPMSRYQKYAFEEIERQFRK